MMDVVLVVAVVVLAAVATAAAIGWRHSTRQVALLRAAVDSVSDGVLVVDPRGHQLMINESGRRLMGGTGLHGDLELWESTHGMLHADGVTPLRPDEVPLVRALRGETVDGFEMVVRPPGHDRELVFCGSARPLSGAGLPVGAVAAFRDITAKARAEDYARGAQEQLVQLNIDLEARVRARTGELEQQARALQTAIGELEAFSYSVSHDLRAPLRAMNGFTRLLLDEYAGVLPGPALAYVAKVRDNADQLGQLVDALLTYSRMQRQNLHSRAVDMTELVRRAGREVCQRALPREIDLVVDDLPECQGDPAMLRQAWIHLLDNAVKFTRPREHPRVEVTGRVEADEVVYRVRDNGVGFDSRYADKLFKVFQRMHPPGQFEGIGIGLALTERVIARHGGWIRGESGPDGGAAFEFSVRRPA